MKPKKNQFYVCVFIFISFFLGYYSRSLVKQEAYKIIKYGEIVGHYHCTKSEQANSFRDLEKVRDGFHVVLLTGNHIVVFEENHSYPIYEGAYEKVSDFGYLISSRYIGAYPQYIQIKDGRLVYDIDYGKYGYKTIPDGGLVEYPTKDFLDNYVGSAYCDLIQN